MAAPSTGLGSSGHAGAGGMIRIHVDVTGISTPDLSGVAVFPHSVAAGRSIAEALPDILGAVGIRPPYVTEATNEPRFKVRVDLDGDGSVDNDVVDLSQSWRSVGVHEMGSVDDARSVPLVLTANVAILDA